MRRTIFALLAGFAFSGCALLTETECHADAAGWEWRGSYDAVQGDQPWIEAYAKHCGSVDKDAYLQGWDVGHAEFERRVNIAD